MKRIIKKIHLWIGFPIGLIITVVCLSGAILVFRAEIEETLYPGRFFVKEKRAEPISLDELIPSVNAQLENNSVAGVTISSDPERNYMMSLREGRHDAAYVNQYTGELIEINRFSENFLTKIMQLHRWLLDGKITTGKAIVGYSTLLFAIMLITGIIISIPKSRRNLKHLFIIHVRRGLKRFWHDLHISAGIYSMLILLVLTLTGLTWSFRWYSVGVYKLFGVELPAMSPNRGATNVQQQGNNRGEQAGQNVQPEQRGQGGNRGERNRQDAQPEQGRQGDSRGERNIQPTDFSHWQTVFIEVRKQNPDFKTVSIQNSSVSVSQKRIWGNVRAADRYIFDAQTGTITDYVPYENQEKTMKIRGWLYTLHVGAWGGWFSKIISCIAALIGASLPLTGYYMFYKKRWRKKSRKA
jgi:uncharacterized iron-regulated membrane protein